MVMDSDRIRLLQQVPIFGGITAENLGFLLREGQRLCFRRGQYLFREGDPAEVIYVLESGAVQVFRQQGPERHTLHRLGEGDCLGEMALIDLFPRSASALAETDGSAIAFSPEAMLGLYQKDLEQFTLIQMNLARELSRRLRHANDLLFSQHP
ncbi:MAG: cyclic nucleotide-binding domain-containing protein [Oleiphilaceae bacterium]|nr:cyclic nucleotide-binding domain-containing protein [Oleiphilaceae bacterium]